MIKADIVKAVADKLKMKEKDALRIVDATLESIKSVILRERRLEVRNFGVFQIRVRKPRTGRNPKNRQEYPIHEHKVVTFKAGKGVKEKKKSVPLTDS